MVFKGAFCGEHSFAHIITGVSEETGDIGEFLVFPLYGPWPDNNGDYDDSHIVFEAPLSCWHCHAEKKVTMYKGAIAYVQLPRPTQNVVRELFGKGAMVFVRICGTCRRTGLFSKAKWYRQECLRDARRTIVKTLYDVYGKRLIRVKSRTVAFGAN